MGMLSKFETNLRQGMEYCLEIANAIPYPGENLASIPPCVESQRERLDRICERLEILHPIEKPVFRKAAVAGG